MNKPFLYFTIVALFVACRSEPGMDTALNMITEQSLMEPVEILASDEFMGRATGTEGEQKSVDYLVDYLSATCAEPGMPDGTWTQQVPLTGQVTGRDAVLRITDGGDEIYRFNYADDFIAWPANLSENISVEGAELLYVGYGIQAPEEGWDDFKGMDVEGKVLVVKNNDPDSSPDLFDGETRLYYGRWGYKYEKAKELGATGVLIIHTTATAGYDWSVVANSWSAESFYLEGDGSGNESATRFNGWLTRESSEALFERAGLDLDEQLAAAEDRSFEPVSLGNMRLSLELEASYRSQVARNVIGVIPGSDQDLRDEYLVLTAHYDHLGVTTPVEGDSINNGALDNAAGVSALLNMAEAYCSVQSQLKRSVLLLLVGAEEVGLLGSQYWAEHPTVHPGKVTANINLDGMNVYGRTRDLVLIGYGRSTVSDIIERQAQENGRIAKPDEHPDRGYFYRSDHFSLAKKGIPAVFPAQGSEYLDKPEGYGAMIDSLSAANYHSVNDEINEHWDLSGMVEDVQLFFQGGYEILNSPGMMEWREGDEFEQTREAMLREAGMNPD